ncbi:ATP-grasp domain-containing protein [Aerococcus urinaehominis]|uniref:ATP-grasp domain-containing protein n=1 Tax=Aerococcus urinaehominis TaxID=128944 RepID=UPI00088565C0|nr:ATP-grasp domain-containing protein [Aerococcus urinaehominis]SDM08407.1 ATP-grasp domain-containing protein [Aerococcus urinaehominis]
MNYLILAPNQPANSREYVRRLADHQVQVLAIGDCQYDQLDGHLKSHLTEYYYVPSLADQEAVVRGLAFFIHKYGLIDRVTSFSPAYQELAAHLRQQFNIEGAKPREMGRVTNKSHMKQFFEKAFVPVAKGQAIKTKRQLTSAAKKLDFPLIAKPDAGYDLAQIYYLADQDDLDQFAETWDLTPYLLEEACDFDQLVQVIGMVDDQGQVAFAAAVTSPKGLRESQSQGGEFAFTILPEMDDLLVAHVDKIVKQFKFKHTMFSLEFLQTGDKYLALVFQLGNPMPILADLVNYSFDMDSYDYFARLEAQTGDLDQPEFKEAVYLYQRPLNGNYRYDDSEIRDLYPETALAYQVADGQESFLIKEEAGETIFAPAE